MRVASVAADLVAANAIGSGALLVTARTRQNIATRFGAVQVGPAEPIADPTGWMRIGGAKAVSAHSALDVAGVTSLGRVTRGAGNATV